MTTADKPPVGPRPSVSDPRRRLLEAVLEFVRDARKLSGVHRIALMGSLATDKPVPKDADVLVVIDDEVDFETLARLGRRLKGAGQRINLGADIFLADSRAHYLGRICHYRECFPRMACEARHCGRRQHLNDDLHLVNLSALQVVETPVDLVPTIVRRCPVPDDVEALLLAPLESRKNTGTDGPDLD
jgi:predicted nucleotidyltransferase